MPKKKKKSRASTSSSSDPPQDKTALRVVEDDIADCIQVQIVDSATPPVKSLRHTPMIILTAEDSQRLNVVTGDFVLLLSIDESSILQSTAIARVHVSSGAATTPKFATPKKKQSSPSLRRSKLSSAGYCHVFPSSLAQQLKGKLNNASSINTEAGQDGETPPLVTTPTTSSSPSPSRFSFAKGGGGDRMIQSPSRTPKKTTKKGATKPPYELWVVPVDSDLGDRLTPLLCREAAHLRLDAVASSESPTDDDYPEEIQLLREGGATAQHLMLAHLVSSYLSLGRQVTLSVLGRSVSCQVMDIRASSASASLESQMASLSIADNNDEDKADNDVERLVRIVEQGIQRSDATKLLLHMVDYDTKVSFGQASEDNAADYRQAKPPTPLVVGLDATVAHVESLLMTPLQHPELFQHRLL